MNKIVTLMCLPLLLSFNITAIAQDNSESSELKKDGAVLKIKIASVLVDDQDKAEKFYTEVLGFIVKDNIPVGDFRWLTVVSPEDPEGTQLLLEPNANAAAKTFQKAMFDQGIPATLFFVTDVQKTYKELKGRGVKFTMQPTDVGTTIIAVFDDTCGNLIQIVKE